VPKPTQLLARTTKPDPTHQHHSQLGAYMTRECALPQICNAGYLAPPNAEDRHPTAINISTLLLISNSFIASHITLIYLHKSIHIALHNTADLNLSTRLATIQSCTHVNTNIANSYQSTTLALKNLRPSRLASCT
jgi:hypothetical protein